VRRENLLFAPVGHVFAPSAKGATSDHVVGLGKIPWEAGIVLRVGKPLLLQLFYAYQEVSPQVILKRSYFVPQAAADFAVA
jgi:hypothetical protein